MVPPSSVRPLIDLLIRDVTASMDALQAEAASATVARAIDHVRASVDKIEIVLAELDPRGNTSSEDEVHELRNPVAALQLSLDLLKDRLIAAGFTGETMVMPYRRLRDVIDRIDERAPFRK